MKELRFGARIGGVRSDADTGGDLHVDSRLLQPDGLADQGVQPARYAERVFFGSLRQEDHELVASVAECEGDHPAFFFDGSADFGQELRAHQVAVGVVYILEMVEVDEDQPKLERV